MSRRNFFAQTPIQANALKTIIYNLGIDLDADLLITIQDYLGKVKQNSAEIKECLDITISENSDALSAYYWKGDENNPSGIYLSVWLDCMSEKEIDAYDGCDLRSCFGDENCVCLHHDAELICRVIQYLSMNIFGVPSNKIKLDISLPEVDTSDGESTKTMIMVLAAVIGILFGAAITLFEYLDVEGLLATVGTALFCVYQMYSYLKKANNFSYVPRVLLVMFIVGFISCFAISALAEL